eukprot:COSAG06_NODE_20946_length_775_cov_1.622781_1_plen_81_part_10
MHVTPAPLFLEHLSKTFRLFAEWGEWGACSRSCAPAGEMTRQFDVIRPDPDGGTGCGFGNIAVGKASTTSSEIAGGYAWKA